MEKKEVRKTKPQKAANKSNVSENDLINSVPSAPTLEDFISTNAEIAKATQENDGYSKDDKEIKEQSDVSQTEISSDEEKIKKTVSDTTSEVTKCNSEEATISKSVKIKQGQKKPCIVNSLYPDLGTVENKAYIEDSLKHLQKEHIVEEMSINEFHENSLKNPVGRHVYEYVHAFLNDECNLLEDDWFYRIIQQYLNSRLELSSIRERILEINKHCVKLRSSVWAIDHCTVAQTKMCKDNTSVTAKHDYKTATLNQSNIEDLSRNCKDLRECCHKTFVNHDHISSVLKIKIEQYVCDLCNIAEKTEEQKLRIKLCISILFRFIRKEQTEMQFTEDVKMWLDTFIREFLNYDLPHKELFLLNHILRCPPGISWAIKYLQCPEPTHINAFLPNSNVELCLVFLYTILSPVEKRDHFLKSADVNLGSISQAIASWILVDSDGEDDSVTVVRPLKESDMLSLINQIPFELFFSSILISNKNYQNVSPDIAYEEFMNFIKFCTTFVYILSKGLRTYNSSRYSTLTMLLGRLIKHSLDYVTEEFKIYSLHPSNKSVSVEYDAFCIRVVHSIIWSNNSCKWQLLTTVMWQHISARALWCIFDHVYCNIEERDWALHKMEKYVYESKYQQEDEQLFLDKAMKLPENELYFLLHTLSNMTMNRKIEDFKFIIKITDVILKIGFYLPNSSNSKWARIYISSICEKYPQVISYVISEVKSKITSSIALYLFKDIILKAWIPQPYDMNVISSWLLDFSYQTPENELGKYILSNLNYGIDNINGQFFLPKQLHYEIGLLVTRSCLVHDKQAALKNKSYVAEGIKHVTNLVWSATSDAYHKWCFEILRKLKIHCFSQGDDISKACCLPSKEPLRNIPDLERLPEISEGVSNKHPVACYFAILATTSGHSVPVIHSKGLHYIKILDQCKEHEALIHALYLIVPLFLECQEELIENTMFTDLLNALLKERVSISKQIFGGVADIPEISIYFNNMIIHQIMSYQRYALCNPSSLIIFWLHCIFKLDWGCNSVAYILNNLSQMVYVFPNCRSCADDIIKSVLIQNTSTESKSFLSWIYPSNNIMTYSNFKAPWLEKLILQMKHHLSERSTDLWKEIVEQINVYEGKLNLEKAIQKAAVVINTTLNSKQLCVYRWAELGLEIPVEHPIAPLIWHQFFYLLLERIKISNGRTCCFGLNFLSDSNVNVKTLSEHFEKTQKWFLASVSNLQSEFSNDQYDQSIRNKLELHHNLSRLYGLFKIWLSDTRVFDANFEITNLSQHYEPPMLYAFMTNNCEIMLPFLDTISMHINIMDMVKNFEEVFLKPCFGKMTPSSSRTFSDLSPLEKIKAKLSSYEAPVNLEPIDNSCKMVFEVQEDVVNDLSATKKYLQKYIHLLSQYARGYSKRLLDHTSLNYSLFDLYPLLYQNVPFKKTVMANCTALALYDRLMWREPKPCTGPIEITLEYTDLQMNESVDRKIQRNVNDTDNLISNAMINLPMDLCLATATVQEIIRLICHKKSTIGKDMFYFMLDLRYKEKNSFPPLDSLYDDCLSDLSKAFYYNDENSIAELLKKIELNSNYLPLLSNFLPIDYLTPAGFVMIYSYINGCSLSIEDKIMLLEKFDVSQWLSTSKNNHVYVLELLYVIENSILTPSVFEFDENLFEIHKILVRHMMSIYHYNYPNYYWHILEVILKGLNNLNITPHCLECFINAYCAEQKLDFSKNDTCDRGYWRQIRPNNNPATRKILPESCMYLNKYFLSERMHNGVHGLYSRYKKYFTAMQILLGTITTCSAFSVKEMVAGSAKIDEKQFINMILSAWKPWLLPLWPSRLEEKPPDWVLQLSLDGPLLPWSSTDLPEVNKMILTYIDCILILDECLPGGEVLRYLFDIYIVDFCNPKVPSHIIKQINTGLLQIPWKNYTLNQCDVINMHRTMMQFLPDCHYLIAYAFVQMKWKEFLQSFFVSYNDKGNLNILSLFIELLTHIAYEPSLRNKESMLKLIEGLLHFKWNVIEYSTVNTLLNWFVMSANPIGLLSTKPDYNTDRAVLRIIEATVGVNSDCMEFAKIFSLIRAKVRILEIIAKRNLAPGNAEKSEFQKVIQNLLNLSQSVVNNNANKDIAIIEGSELFKEIFTLLNLNDSRYNYVDFAQKSILEFIRNSLPKSCVLSMLKVLFTVTNESLNAMVMENLLVNYFTTVQDGSIKHWQFLSQEIGQIFIPSLKVLTTGSYMMSLHIKYMRLITESNSEEVLLKKVQCMFDNLHHLTPTINNEHLLPLLWFDALSAITSLMKDHQKNIIQHFNSFCCYLEKMADTSSGLFGIIKLTRDSISEKFRILCRIMQTFILSQIYIVDNEIVLKTSSVRSGQNIPEYDTAKLKLLSLKTNNIEKLLLEKGMRYIEETDIISCPSTVLKSLLLIAYEQHCYYECL